MAVAKNVRSSSVLTIGLRDRLTERGAEVTHGADNLAVQVPAAFGTITGHAKWILAGALRIRPPDQQAG